MNPNTMTFKTVFSNEYQMSHYKQAVYQIFADTRLEGGLTKGQTVERSYASDVVTNDMGGDGSYSTQAITDTAETLTIDKEKEASIYIKQLDLLQAHLPVKRKYGSKLANALINQIDADVMYNMYTGAGTSMDDGDFAGTAGNALTVTSANVATVFTTAMQKLRLNNVIYQKRFKAGMKLEEATGMPSVALSPEILTYIELYLGGKDTLLGDKATTNGYTGYFHGFECFMSNALPWTGVLALATIPADGDTITINGVILTYVDTLGTTAGNIHIASDVDKTRANTAAFLAAPTVSVASGTDAGAVALSTANANKLKNMTFTNNDTSNTLTVVSRGHGTVVVSETITDGADVWTAAQQKLFIIFALGRSISLVVQKKPSLVENPVTGKIGRDYIAWTVYGSYVFVDQAPQIVKLAVNSSAFTASAALSR